MAKKINLNKKSKIIISAVAAVIVAVAVIIIAVTCSSSGKEEVSGFNFPNLAGCTVEEVEEKLTSIGMDKDSYIIIGTQFDEDAEPGTVVWQSIKAKTVVADDKKSTTVVKLKIAENDLEDETAEDLPEGQSKMPSLLGISQVEAESEMIERNFSNYKVERVDSENYKPGLVCKQSVAAGSVISQDSEITIYVSKVPEVTTTKNTAINQVKATAKHTTTKKATTTKRKKVKPVKVTTAKIPKIAKQIEGMTYNNARKKAKKAGYTLVRNNYAYNPKKAGKIHVVSVSGKTIYCTEYITVTKVTSTTKKETTTKKQTTTKKETTTKHTSTTTTTTEHSETATEPTATVPSSEGSTTE